MCGGRGPAPPHPRPKPSPGRPLACTPPPACEVRWGKAVVARLPPAPGLASRWRRRLSAAQTQLGWRAAQGGRGQAGGAALGPQAATDGGSGGSRRARSPRAHKLTPPRRDPRIPAAGGHTDAETRARRALLSAHAPRPRAARGAECAPGRPAARGPAARPRCEQVRAAPPPLPL